MTSGCYLVHFDRPFGHARHYLGWANDIDGRLWHHANGTGANLLRHVRNAGIGWRVTRLWLGATRTDERRMKGHSSVRLCPICSPTALNRYREVGFAASPSKGDTQ